MISVVIPTYNRFIPLLEAIESVKTQTYKNIELIFINDGSTDNTKEIIDNFLNFGIATIMQFPSNNQIKKEYAMLRRKFGNGESACMAVARFNDNVLASSNLKDIKEYCTTYNIEYLTTMDFLVEAFNADIFDEATCDLFIYDVKSKGSKLPCNTIKEYLLIKKDRT